MTIKRLIASNSQEVEALARTLLQERLQFSDPCSFFVSDFSAIMQYKKKWVGKDFMFGLEIVSFSSWLEDRWSLYGDGRQVISSMQRKINLCEALLGAYDERKLQSLSLSTGTVELLASMVQKEFASLLISKQDLVLQSHLSPAEQELLEVLSIYGKLIQKKGLSEPSEIMSHLGKKTWSSPPILVEDYDGLSRTEKLFLEELSEKIEVCAISREFSAPVFCKGRSQELVDIQARIFNPQTENPVVPQGALEILLPSGQYAAPLLIAETIRGYVRKECRRIALSSARPIELFKSCSLFLSDDPVGFSLNTSTGFADTDFGKLWNSLLTWQSNISDYKVLMGDMLCNPLTFTDVSTRVDLDTKWRMDRAGDKASCLQDIASHNPFLHELINRMSQASYLSVLDKIESKITKYYTSDICYRTVQLKACEMVRDFLRHANFEVDNDSLYADMLCSLQVPIKLASADTSLAEARVDIMDMRSLSRLPACSYDAVFICDLDASSYPIKAPENAEVLLFEKLGIAQGEDVFDCERKVFFEALSVPEKYIVCERVLFDRDVNPSYPAIMFEELIDCYRSDLRSTEDKDKLTGLPYHLLPFSRSLGENLLYQQLSLSDGRQKKMTCAELGEIGQIHKSSRKKVIGPLLNEDHDEGVKLRLSPSSLENYLKCPYFWFVKNRLNVSSIDASFGPLEKGSFIHQVLKDFYLEYQKTIEPKLSMARLSEGQDLFVRVFEEHLQMQHELEPYDNPLIAHSALEQAELREFKEDSLRFLEQETQFLPGFEPYYFEYFFGKEKPLQYAGASLRGCIDRIDVNKKGQAVVIDYKGSLSRDYAFSSASPVPWAKSSESEDELILPHKIQTLLYAQAVRRDLGLDVVAAVYLSYGKKTQVMGAYDPRILGPADLLGVNADICSINLDTYRNFSFMLDNIETRLEPVIEALRQSLITPFPRGSDPCAYCPVPACASRRYS